MGATSFGLLYHAEDLPDRGRTELGLAAARGDLTDCQRLIEQGADPSEADSFLETPLHLACNFGHLHIVKALLRDYGVDVDPANWENWTPLCFAVARGHIPVLKLLLKNKANGQWMSPQGWQLMHLAAWFNQDSTVNWLSTHGATTLAESVHAHRPFDLSRPGKTRCSLYEAMRDERELSL